MLQRLHTKPTDVEGVKELEDFADGLNEGLNSLAVDTKATLDLWDVVDAFFHCAKPEQVALKHEMLGWPKQLWDRVEVLRDEVVELRAQFLAEMHADQTEFESMLTDIASEVNSLGGYTDVGKIDAVALHVRSVKEKIADAQAKSLVFMNRQAIFGEAVVEYDILTDIAKSFEPYRDLWESVAKWTDYRSSWMNQPLSALDSEFIDKEANALFKLLNKTARSLEGNAAMEFQMTTCMEIKEEIGAFRPCLPLISSLRTPGMEQRHWEAISEKLGARIFPDDQFTLKVATEQHNMLDQLEVINKIAETAAKENAIVQALDKMEEAWAAVDLVITPYRETGTAILSEIDVYMALLDEQVTMTQAMTFSAFKGPFEERIDAWNRALSNTSEVLDEWVKVQRNWM